MFLAPLRRRAWYLAAVGAVSVAGFLGLATGRSGPASASGAAVTPGHHLSTEIAEIPSRSASAPTAVVVSARIGDCGTEQLTALAPEDCK
jgi:hypothetical protein